MPERKKPAFDPSEADIEDMIRHMKKQGITVDQKDERKTAIELIRREVRDSDDVSRSFHKTRVQPNPDAYTVM